MEDNHIQPLTAGTTEWPSPALFCSLWLELSTHPSNWHWKAQPGWPPPYPHPASSSPPRLDFPSMTFPPISHTAGKEALAGSLKSCPGQATQALRNVLRLIPTRREQPVLQEVTSEIIWEEEDHLAGRRGYGSILPGAEALPPPQFCSSRAGSSDWASGISGLTSGNWVSAWVANFPVGSCSCASQSSSSAHRGGCVS